MLETVCVSDKHEMLVTKHHLKAVTDLFLFRCSFIELESKFSMQQTIIDELKSEKEAAESQYSYCDRQLSSKRSQVYRLESENERLENSEERCSSDLRDQKTSLTSMEERYNLLIKSEFSLP